MSTTIDFSFWSNKVASLEITDLIYFNCWEMDWMSWGRFSTKAKILADKDIRNLKRLVCIGAELIQTDSVWKAENACPPQMITACELLDRKIRKRKLISKCFYCPQRSETDIDFWTTFHTALERTWSGPKSLIFDHWTMFDQWSCLYRGKTIWMVIMAIKKWWYNAIWKSSDPINIVLVGDFVSNRSIHLILCNRQESDK